MFFIFKTNFLSEMVCDQLLHSCLQFPGYTMQRVYPLLTAFGITLELHINALIIDWIKWWVAPTGTVPLQNGFMANSWMLCSLITCLRGSKGDYLQILEINFMSYHRDNIYIIIIIFESVYIFSNYKVKSSCTETSWENWGFFFFKKWIN